MSNEFTVCRLPAKRLICLLIFPGYCKGGVGGVDGGGVMSHPNVTSWCVPI